MNKSKIITIVICLLFIFSSVALASKSDYFNEAQSTQNSQKLDTAYLFQDFNKKISSHTDVQSDFNALIPIMKELINRKNEIQNHEIIEFINDKSNSFVARENMIDFFMIKNAETLKKEEIKSLLTQDGIENELKSRIVITGPISIEDTNLLIGFIREDSGILAFNSLKRLSKLNEELAYEISREILTEIDLSSELKISAALKATAKYLSNQSNRDTVGKTSEIEHEFINLNTRIIYESSELLKDAALFALSEIGSKESLSEIISNKAIENELKAYAIEENVNVLKDILQNSPNNDELLIVMQAMEIIPIRDLSEDFEMALRNINNQDLMRRAEVILKSMELEGIQSTAEK